MKTKAGYAAGRAAGRTTGCAAGCTWIIGRCSKSAAEGRWRGWLESIVAHLAANLSDDLATVANRCVALGGRRLWEGTDGHPEQRTRGRRGGGAPGISTTPYGLVCFFDVDLWGRR